MIPAAKLKQNLKFNKNLDELIEVMKLAATLQFNQFRGRQEPREDFLSSLEEMFSLIPGQSINNVFLNPQRESLTAIILVSSDEGFLGELNVLLVNRLTEIKAAQSEVIVLGRQGGEYMSELNMDFTAFATPSEKLEFKDVEPLRDYVFNRYRKGEISKIQIIYPRFVNIAVQQIESEILLPLPLPLATVTKTNEEIIIEPGFNSVIEGCVKLWLGFRMYQIFWSSKLAEFAARIMHLEASMQELKRINQHLELEYFKYLHSISDKAIREISASRLLQRH
jgi:F-type H+-transporting ATPase subunit gamma